MKKKLKSILSAILALAMIACMAVPAFAEGNIIIYNNGSAPQQGQPGPGPKPGPQGEPQGGPKQGPGPAPQTPAPKSNSNYDYAVLKGNTGTYKQDFSKPMSYNMYSNWSTLSQKPVSGKILLVLSSIVYAPDGLNVSIEIYNGLGHAITVKRLDRLLITKYEEVIAKVPHQIVNSTTIKADDHGSVTAVIAPQYFTHNSNLSKNANGYSVEADLVYD